MLNPSEWSLLDEAMMTTVFISILILGIVVKDKK